MRKLILGLAMAGVATAALAEKQVIYLSNCEFPPPAPAAYGTTQFSLPPLQPQALSPSGQPCWLRRYSEPISSGAQCSWNVTQEIKAVYGVGYIRALCLPQ